MSRLKKTHRPVVSTANCKAEQVIDRLELGAVETIRLGIATAEEAWFRPARKALAELHEKLGIPGTA